MLHKITGLFRFTRSISGQDDSFPAAIVEAESLAASAGRSRQPSAQEKIAALNRLAVFVEREKLPLIAVLYGPPLRAVADGQRFRGLTIRYAESRSNAPRLVAALLKQIKRRADAVVVTADRQIEQAALASGSRVMHTATLRKALETGDVQHPKQNVRNAPEPRQVDENKRIVNELIDPL